MTEDQQTAACLVLVAIVLMALSSNPQKTAQLKTSIIQGPIEIQKYDGVAYLAAEVQDYWRMSLKAIKDFQPELIIWPETVIVNPVADDVRIISEETNLPYHPQTNFLSGAISEADYNDPQTDLPAKFNSTFLIRRDGSIAEPYHKQILMPFGEYMPFEDYLPYNAIADVGFGFLSGKGPSSVHLDQAHD